MHITPHQMTAPAKPPQTESDRLHTAKAGPFDLASTSFRVKCEGKMRRAEAMSSLETHAGSRASRSRSIKENGR